MNTEHTFIEQLRGLYAQRHEPEKRHQYADAYWRALLMMTVLVIAVSFLYAAGLLATVLIGLDTDFTPNPKNTPTLINRAQLTKTISTFQDRQKAFDSFKTANTPTVVDPS